MMVVGLTGGIATGKSTVGRMLEERGVPVIDADQAARAVLAPGTDGLASVIAHFGEAILTADGTLDRSALRERISQSPEDRAVLDTITHPRIRAHIAEAIQRELAGGAGLVVVEAALLVETGSYRMYPALIVVTCDPETQLTRVMARDHQTEAQARAFIRTQLPLADKEAVATHLIRNDGDLQDLERQVDEVLAALRSAQ